jgi:hypothetical protein
MIKKRCFVIMPFSKTKGKRDESYWNGFFDDLVSMLPDHQVYRSVAVGNIPKRIFSELAMADLVIAVITDGNPTVAYELGMRHSCQKNTVLLIREGDEIPFYLKNFGMITYDESDRERLRRELAQYIQYIQGVSHRAKDNPIADIINTEILVAIHSSMGVLHETVEIIEAHGTGASATPERIWADLRRLQRADEIQVSVVDTRIDSVIFHFDAGHTPHAKLLWNDSIKYSNPESRRNGTASLYGEMKAEKRGFRLGPLDEWWDRQKRLTAISFKTVDARSWLVIVEAHFRTGDLRLIEGEPLKTDRSLSSSSVSLAENERQSSKSTNAEGPENG